MAWLVSWPEQVLRGFRSDQVTKRMWSVRKCCHSIIDSWKTSLCLLRICCHEETPRIPVPWTWSRWQVNQVDECIQWQLSWTMDPTRTIWYLSLQSWRDAWFHFCLIRTLKSSLRFAKRIDYLLIYLLKHTSTFFVTTLLEQKIFTQRNRNDS